MRVSNLRLAAALAMMSAAAVEAQPMLPEGEPEPGSARNRPSGNTPVAGGGAKERARRLARMSKQPQQ